MSDDLSNSNYFNAGWDFRDGQRQRGQGRVIHVLAAYRHKFLAEAGEE